MLFMIVEKFRGGDAAPVYRRLRDQGRMMPDGVAYVSSWVTADMTRCYQVVECDDPTLIDRWTSRWADLVDFEVVPVITSAQAAQEVDAEL